VSMEDVLRSEVVGNSQSHETGEEETLIDGKPTLAMSNLASMGEAPDVLTERKGGDMLVMGKASHPYRP